MLNAEAGERILNAEVGMRKWEKGQGTEDGKFFFSLGQQL